MRVDITVGDNEKNAEQTATATSLTVRIAPIALFAEGIGLAGYGQRWRHSPLAADKPPELYPHHRLDIGYRQGVLVPRSYHLAPGRDDLRIPRQFRTAHRHFPRIPIAIEPRQQLIPHRGRPRGCA